MPSTIIKEGRKTKTKKTGHFARLEKEKEEKPEENKIYIDTKNLHICNWVLEID